MNDDPEPAEAAPGAKANRSPAQQKADKLKNRREYEQPLESKEFDEKNNYVYKHVTDIHNTHNVKTRQIDGGVDRKETEPEAEPVKVQVSYDDDNFDRSQNDSDNMYVQTAISTASAWIDSPKALAEYQQH